MEIASRFNSSLMYLVMECEKAARNAKESGARVVSEGPQPASCEMLDKKLLNNMCLRIWVARSTFEFSISFQEKTQFRVSLMIATIGD